MIIKQLFRYVVRWTLCVGSRHFLCQIKTLMIKLHVSRKTVICKLNILRNNGLSVQEDQLFQEKKPVGRESKNQLLPTHPHHPMIYTGPGPSASNGQRFSQNSQPRYSQLSNGYSNGGSVYYPGQRHPDMLPDDEAL